MRLLITIKFNPIESAMVGTKARDEEDVGLWQVLRFNIAAKHTVNH